MANRIHVVNVHAGIYGIGIYAIMLPSGGFSVAHCLLRWNLQLKECNYLCIPLE